MQALDSRISTSPRNPWPAQPLRVALVITDLDVGGAERALVALATRLDRRRWNPSVFCLGPEGKLVEPLRNAGIETTCLAVNRRRPLQAVRLLARALRLQRPELVQSFLFHANVASRLASLWTGRPRPWLLGGLRVAEHEKRWHLTLDRMTASLSSGSVCVSRGVERFTREVGRWPADRLTVIPNGIDPGPIDLAPVADRSALGVPAGAHLALFVGRIELQKGLPVLLDAAEFVAWKRPDWHLVLAGDGPDRADFMRWTTSTPELARRVHWLGFRDDVPSLLKAADVLVLPSLWEGMPNVVLEAFAARRAVLATAVEGTEELIESGQNGWLVPPGEVNSLADALLEAAADPERTRRYGLAGRAKIEAEFTLAKVVRKYERLWARVLGLEPPEAS